MTRRFSEAISPARWADVAHRLFVHYKCHFTQARQQVVFTAPRLRELVVISSLGGLLPSQP